MEKNKNGKKIYNNFQDQFGNHYNFDTYSSFANFWFRLSNLRRLQFSDYKKLESAASNSQELDKKYMI